jgi:competence protein ComEC
LGVSAVLTVGSGELAEPLGAGDLGLIARHAFAAQQSALNALRRYIGGPASETTATTAASVIFGVHATPPPSEITEAFRRSGTIHLLVVSGAVVSMVFGMVFLPGALGARWRRLYVERQSGWPISYRGRVRLHPGLWAAVIAMLVVTYYSVLTEGGQAVARAAVMGVLAALALVLRRAPRVAREHGLSIDHFTLLAAAALVVLVASPRALFQPGFQLSFAAVAAILYLTPKAMWLVRWLPRWLGYIIAGTLAAQLATFPILVWHFGQAPLAGFGANLLAIPLAAVVLAGGMATCALAVLAPWAAPAAGWATGLATRWLVWVSGAFASLPWASVSVPRPNAAVVVVWYLALIGLGRLADRSRRYR